MFNCRFSLMISAIEISNFSIETFLSCFVVIYFVYKVGSESNKSKIYSTISVTHLISDIFVVWDFANKGVHCFKALFSRLFPTGTCDIVFFAINISVEVNVVVDRTFFKSIVGWINDEFVQTSIFFCAIKTDFYSHGTNCVINALIQEIGCLRCGLISRRETAMFDSRFSLMISAIEVGNFSIETFLSCFVIVYFIYCAGSKSNKSKIYSTISVSHLVSNIFVIWDFANKGVHSFKALFFALLPCCCFYIIFLPINISAKINVV